MRFQLAARQAAAQELTAWLERRDIGDGIRLVTGDPGAGKSWLLARTAFGSDAEAREFTDPVDGPLPPEGAFDGVADASGESESEWLRSLAAGMGLDAAVTSDLDYGGLARAVEQPEQPPGILLSGVPGRLRVTTGRAAAVPELVRNLIDSPTTGRPGGGSAFLLAEVGRDALAQLLRRYPRLEGSVIDLDSERFAPDRVGFQAWVQGLLDVPDSAYTGDSAGAAAAVTAVAWPNFLLAEVLAMELRVRPEAVADLPDSLEGAWEFVVDSFGPVAPRARQLLAPLVLAEGVLGMPDELRVRAAAAVHGREVTVDQLEQFEDAVAAFVAEEFAEDESAAQSGLVRHARLRDGALAEAAAASYGGVLTEVQRRIAAVVREYIPADVAAVARGRALSPAESYALKFGVGHAVSGGRLDDWLADVRILALSDPEALAEAIAASGGPATDPVARRRSGAVAEAVRLYREDLRCGVAEWASRLRFAAQMWGDRELIAALDALGLALPWRADWARWRPLGVFDTRVFSQGWTGPVQVAGWRTAANGAAAAGEVCLHSAQDQRYRWYSLASGDQVGEAVAEFPSASETPEGPAADPGFTVEVLDDSFDLLRTRIRSTDSPEQPVFSLCSPYPGAQAHPLPDGRVLLAGHSGAAVIRFGGAPASGAGPESWTTPPELMPSEAWWQQGELTADDIVPYYQGGVAYADPGRLGPLAERADVVHVLCKLGLPGFPVFWQETFGCLESLATLEEHLTEQGESAPADTAGFTVIAFSGDGDTALCVDHSNGQVLQAEGGVPELVNTSLLNFAACQAMTSWALSVSTARQPAERYEFLAFVREVLTRIDPEAAAEQGTDWWWFLALEDDYTLVA